MPGFPKAPCSPWLRGAFFFALASGVLMSRRVVAPVLCKVLMAYARVGPLPFRRAHAFRS